MADQEQAHQRLPGTIELISGACEEYRKRFLLICGIALPPFLLSLFSTLTLGGASWFDAVSITQFIYGGVLGIVTATLSALFLYVWTPLAYAYVFTQEGGGNVRGAYTQSVRKTFSYFWFMLVMTSVFIGGFALLVVPGIIFSIWFSVALYVFVAEGARGFKALVKSTRYVKGYWWAVLGRLLLFSLLFLVAGVTLEGSFALIRIFLPLSFASLFTELVNLVFLTPFGMAYTYLIYRNLKERAHEETPSDRTRKVFMIFAVLGVVATAAFLIALGIWGARVIPLLKERGGAFTPSFNQQNIDVPSFQNLLDTDTIQTD